MQAVHTTGPAVTTTGERHTTQAHTSTAERMSLSAIILLYVALAIAYARFVPWGEAPDEPAHFRYVEYVVRYQSLPLISAVHPYTNEAQQPPLYYGIGAATLWTYRLITGNHLNSPLFSDVRFNPEVLDPKKQPVYNVLQHDLRDRFPFNAYLLRGLSIVLGIGAVLLTYAAARKVVPPPSPAAPALVAALVFALVPQRIFIGMSVSNENLSTLMSAWLLFLVAVRFTERGSGEGARLSRQTPLLMGVALGLGVLSKYTVAAWLVPLLWSLWAARWADRRGFGRDCLAMLGVAALLAGPLLLFNIYKYGDPVAGRAVAAMLPNDSTFRMSDLFWFKEPFRAFLWTSFWGTFGWQRIWMADAFYYFFDILTLAGVAGGIRILWTKALSAPQRQMCGALLLHLLIVYAVIVVYSLRIVAWQGREMFPALPGVAVLFGFGLVSLLIGYAGTDAEGTGTQRGALAGWLALGGTALALLAANVAALNTIRDAFGGVWK